MGPQRIELRGAGVDESPHCYKRLAEVLGEHHGSNGSIKTLHTLRPLGVAMAEFRFNRRNRSDLFVDTLRHMITADPLTFEALIA
jgi:hypothetical protein